MPFQDVAATIQALPQEKNSVFQQVAETLHRNKVTQEPTQLPKLASNQDSNFALRQNQNNQGVAQSAMSPTDRFAGSTALERPQSTEPSKVEAIGKPLPTPSQSPGGAVAPTPNWSRSGGGRGR